MTSRAVSPSSAHPVLCTPRALFARLACLALLTASACGDGDHLPFVRDPGAVSTPDEPSVEEPDTDEDGGEPPAKPTPVELPPDETSDAGQLDGASQEVDASQLDSSGTETGNADAEANDAAEIDAEMDANSALDAEQGLDSALDTDTSVAPDSGACPDGGQRDACGVCGGSATACHPLFGRYAARTQLYARQRSQLIEQATPLDLVSKGVLLSVVDIDAQGNAKEHLCLLELGGKAVLDGQELPIESWVKPSASEHIPDTTLPLRLTNGRYTRALADHKAYYGWAPSSCPSTGPIPTTASDCRVQDTDLDTVLGGAMFLGIDGKPTNPEAADSQLQLNIAALLSFGWSLPATSSSPMVGNISGGFQLSELSRRGALETAIDKIANTACPEDLGHIELVRNPDASCASLIAGRVSNPETAGLFNVALDGTPPAASACTGASCVGTVDACGVCNGPGIAAGKCDCAGHTLDVCNKCGGTGIAAGTCNCAGTPDTLWYADTDADGLGDPASSRRACLAPAGYVATATDTDPTCAPGKRDECKVCNGPGRPAGTCDCTGKLPQRWYADTDGDGLGDPNVPLDACTRPTGAVDNRTDPCPTSPSPADACGKCGGTGIPTGNCDCQGHKNDECGACGGPGRPSGTCDCAGTLPRRWYADNDGDGLGDPSVPIDACSKPTNAVDNNTDPYPNCRTQPDVCQVCSGTGVPAGKCNCQGQVNDACGVCNGNGSTCAGCDGVPNSGKKVDACGVCGGTGSGCAGCDGVPNSGKKLDECGKCGGTGIPQGTCSCTGTPPATWYRDADNDTLGDPAVRITQCAQPAGYVANASDTDPGCAVARDACGACGGTGFPTGTCDCTGRLPTPWYRDADNDQLGDPATSVTQCTQPAGYVANRNDTDPACAGARDTCNVCNGPGVPAGKCDCAGHVNDACGKCGGTGIPTGACDCTGKLPTPWYRDADSDTLGDPATSTTACTQPSGYVANANDTDPSCGRPRDTCGVCGGSSTGTCPLVGTYAVRSSIYSKQRNGTALEQTKAITYSLVTVIKRADGKLELTDRTCWNQTVPNGGSGAYSWAKPAWVQALPAAVRVLTPNDNGTFTRPAVLTRYGWDPAKQPATCNQNSTPVAPWPSAWGTTCTCTPPADGMPPYDKTGSVFDCRAVDSDADGQPGVSGAAGLNAPAVGSESGNGLATAFAVGHTLDSWSITLGASGRHTANVDDKSVAQVIGCTGIACSALPSSAPPPGVTCPPVNNRAFFIPVSGSSATCSAIISQRETLFAQSQDPTWPDATACPPPP